MDVFKSITMMSIQRFNEDLEFTINWCTEHGLFASEIVCVHCGIECCEGRYVLHCKKMTNIRIGIKVMADNWNNICLAKPMWKELRYGL